MSSQSFNYYNILGVSPTATPKEIKKAYRQLALKQHPDHNQNSKQSEERFKRLQTAYSALSNAETRRLYDEEMAAQNLNLDESFVFEEIHWDFDFVEAKNNLTKSKTDWFGIAVKSVVFVGFGAISGTPIGFLIWITGRLGYNYGSLTLCILAAIAICSLLAIAFVAIFENNL